MHPMLKPVVVKPEETEVSLEERGFPVFRDPKWNRWLVELINFLINEDYISESNTIYKHFSYMPVEICPAGYRKYMVMHKSGRYESYILTVNDEYKSFTFSLHDKLFTKGVFINLTKYITNVNELMTLIEASMIPKQQRKKLKKLNKKPTKTRTKVYNSEE